MTLHYLTVKFKLLLVIFLLFSTLYANASNLTTAQNITAKHIGSGVGGAMFAIAIHPTNKQNIFFSGDMGLVYHTIDGGQTWNIIPGLYRIRFIEFDHNNPSIMWAGGGSGLYKSTDGGNTWNFRFTTYSRYNCTFGAIAIDPTDSNIVYVAEGFIPYLRVAWVRGRVFKSTDGGSSWKRLPRPGGEDPSQDTIYNRNYSKIIIDPNSNYTPGVGHSRVYLMGRDGLFKAEDAGQTWQNITFFDEGQGSDLILINENNHSTLIASVIPIKNHIKKGIYKSTNNGTTWQESNTGLGTIVHALEIRNKDIRNRAQFSLMLAHNQSDKNTIYVGSWQGIAKSTDQGQNWTQTTLAETPYIQHKSGKYVQIPLDTHPHQEKTFNGGIDNFIKLKVADNDSNFVVFTDNQDTHFSTDGGVTWKSRSFDYNNSFVAPDDVLPTLPVGAPKNRYTHTIKSRGIQGTVNTGIAIDPFDPTIYYATYKDIGLQISRDSGQTWEHPTDGLPPRGHAVAVAVNPNSEGILWVSTNNGAIYKSTDKGLTWSNVNIDVPSIGDVVDMTFDAQNNILYAATTAKGIFKSTDGGQSWQNIFNKGTFDIKIDPINHNILYSGTTTGLYKSTDSGINWNQIAVNQMGKVYNISAGKNNTLYVISNIVGESYGWQNRKLWSSTDQGVTFNDITPDFMHKIGAVAVTPSNPNQLYIANNEVSQRYPNDKMIMAISNDGGATWKKIVDNFAFALGNDIYIDPKNENHLFFVTQFSLIEVNNNNIPTLQAKAGNDMTLHRTPSNKAVHLDGSASIGNIISYAWLIDGNFIGNHQKRWYVPTIGTHTVELRIKNDSGDTSTDTMILTVSDNMNVDAGKDRKVTLSPSNPSVILTGKGTPSNNIVKYEWFDNAGNSLGTGSTLDFTPPSSGLYTITLTITDTAGDTASDTVNINATVLTSDPATNIQADAGSDVTLTVTSSQRAVQLDGTNSFAVNGIVSYTWYDNNTYIGPNSTRWYVPNGAGDHDIKLVIMDAQGNTHEDHMTLTVVE